MLDISIELLFFVTVLFLALVFVLNEILYKPLLAFMDKREGSIRDDLAAADQNSGEIEVALLEANEKISVAKSEAAKIREEAIAKAKEIAVRKLQESKDAFENQYTSFLDKLQKERVSLKKGISSNLPSYENAVKSKIKNI